ncbi:MAG: COX15/CtaA family protein [Bradyrhizobiaceae bacterium]|nr:COX15/CtaA family protein [Bradyrhizobiaceae bacterium]
MKEPTSALDARHHAVRLWLLAIAVLIAVMVVVGGATRLTESGLSIVEWRPVSGTLPPLSDAQWQSEFVKYQAIPQYQHLNRGMSLAEFKTIFWWEWTHRQLGRAILVAFLLPFLWFLWRGWIEPEFRARLWTIFGLGALQGGVGWWMVASGLSDRVEVSQYRLATHLVLAALIFVATLWTAQALSRRKLVAVPPRVRVGAVALVILIMIQLYSGALVAGLRAGLIYNTWPLIDGAIIPDASRLFFAAPLWRNFFENSLLAQFDHRMLAYGIWAMSLLHVIDVVRLRRGSAVSIGAMTLFGAVTLQAGLGILTLLHQVPLPLGLAHQGMAMVTLAIAVMHAESVVAPRRGFFTPLSVPVRGPQ